MAPAPADAAAAAAPAPSNLELEGVFVGQGLIAAVINRLASPPVKCDNDNYSCGAQCLDDDPTACYHDCDIAFERCVWCDVPNYNTCMTNCTVDHPSLGDPRFACNRKCESAAPSPGRAPRCTRGALWPRQMRRPLNCCALPCSLARRHVHEASVLHAPLRHGHSRAAVDDVRGWVLTTPGQAQDSDAAAGSEAGPAGLVLRPLICRSSSCCRLLLCCRVACCYAASSPEPLMPLLCEQLS